METKTHKFIISKAVDKLDIEIFKKHKKYLLKGARKADYALSHLCLGSFNHYYNPFKKKGYLFFSNAEARGKKAFEKAVKNYEKGKIKKSMVQLGIALHLIADSAMPSHSKPKMHLPPMLHLFSDNLETFINKNLLIAEMYLDNIKMTVKNSIDEYYDGLSKANHEFRQGKIGLIALIFRVFSIKKMPKQDLIFQTKKIIPESVSYTMGALNIFYERIKK